MLYQLSYTPAGAVALTGAFGGTQAPDDKEATKVHGLVRARIPAASLDRPGAAAGGLTGRRVPDG